MSVLQFMSESPFLTMGILIVLLLMVEAVADGIKGRRK